MKKKDPEIGSIDWFEIARRRCVDHFRAMLSIQSAQRYIAKLVSYQEFLDPDMESALHSSSVMAYARPFTPAKTHGGHVQYPLRELKKAEGFDVVLHEHLIELRNRLVAHSDYAMLRSTMFFQAVGDSHELPVAMGINVKRLQGIESRDLVMRYFHHVGSCVAHIAKTFDSEFDDLARRVRDDPRLFSETANLAKEITEHAAGPELTILPRPSGPAGDVEEPEFVGMLSGYKYELVSHQRALIKSGKYSARVNGVPQEFTFDIQGPEI